MRQLTCYFANERTSFLRLRDFQESNHPWRIPDVSSQGQLPKRPLSPTFYTSRHHHPLGGMGWACKKVRTILLSCGSQARGLDDPAMKGCGRASSRGEGGGGGLCLWPLHSVRFRCRERVEPSCGSGSRRGIWGLFRTAAGLFLCSLTFISVRCHTEGLNSEE